MTNHLNIFTTGPLYEHDCDECVYIATVHEVKNHPHIWDCYWCPTGTVIARSSSEPSDYSSGLYIAQRVSDNILALALQLGISRGIIDPKYKKEKYNVFQ